MIGVEGRPYPWRALRHIAVYRALARLGLAAVVVLSLIRMPVTGLPMPEGDKVGHVLGYFALTFTYAQLLRPRAALITRALAFIALGAVLEYAQSFTGYRSMEWRDFAANTLGVTLGAALGLTRARTWLLRLERHFS